MITECPECKKEMSTTAKQCPHCGFKNPTSLAWLWWIISAIVAFLILGVISGNSPDNQAKYLEQKKIELCWQDYNTKSFDENTKMFIAQTCEKLEADFYTKYRHKP